MTDSGDRPDPDGYRYEKYVKAKTDSVTRFAPKDPEEWIDKVDVSIVPDSVEPLYSASMIQAEIEKRIEDLQKDLDDGNFDDYEKREKVISRKHELEMLEEVFQDQ